MALTDEAITKIRAMIRSGELPPGARLPPEPQLAAQIGLSRSGVREAVKVLEAARVLDLGSVAARDALGQRAEVRKGQLSPPRFHRGSTVHPNGLYIG